MDVAKAGGRSVHLSSKLGHGKTQLKHMLATIHQPNFFPWLGFFDKVRRADVFILLDDVAYPRAGSGGMGSWANRVRLNIQGKAQWVGAPLKRLSLGAPIRDAVVDDSQPWRAKLVKTLITNYGRAANFSRAMPLIESLLFSGEANLAAFNAAAIARIAANLGLRPHFVAQSELPHSGKGTELLITLIKATGCDAYLAGGGAQGYQEDELFDTHSIRLEYQTFVPRPYGPPHSFIPGLSVLDYLMHDGRPLLEAFPGK
jgi:hypothetical protein